MLSIGLMSGTSMDGIDAALLETDGEADIKELGYNGFAYAPEFKILLKAAEDVVRHYQGNMELAHIAYPQWVGTYLVNELHTLKGHLKARLTALVNYCLSQEIAFSLAAVIEHSTYLHALAVKQLLAKTGYHEQQIDVIGYHGQTLFHRPAAKLSIIVGDGQKLADQLGITVVNDFRRRDIALGGQGAPFAPLYHHALSLRDQHIPLAVVNCGGIANITFIHSGDILDLMAFDTGPGNGLIDRLVRQRTQGKEYMDADGRYGKHGKVNSSVFQSLYEKAIVCNQQNYFRLPPPKSLDSGDLALISELNSLSMEDACVTLEAFTADTMVKSLQWITQPPPLRWVLAGGGWNNPVIFHFLKEGLEKKLGNAVKIFRADEFGWNSQGLEAQIFAYLAVRSLQNKPLSVPGTTNIAQPSSGGKAYLAQQGSPTAKVRQLLATNPAVLSGYR